MKLKTTKIMSMCLAIGGVLAIEGAKAQESFVPSGNLWGYAFGDYAFKSHNDTAQRGGGNVQYAGFNGGANSTAGKIGALNTTPVSTPKAGTGATQVPANYQENAFAIRRVYLGYDYQFAPNFTAQVVLANEQNEDAGGKNTMYVKYANVKWSNFIKNQDLVIGQYQTCSFATPYGTEPLWSYRSVERTIMDLHNIDGSTDMGASLQGKLWVAGGAPDSSRPNMIGYFLQVGNNNSAVPSASNFKKVRLNLYGTFLQRNLTVGLYGDLMTTNNSSTKTATGNSTMKAYVSYKSEWFRVGFEVFEQMNKNSDIYQAYSNGKPVAGAVNDTATGVQMGWSVFASGQILKNKLSIFARYDMYNPDTKWNINNVYSKAYSAITGSNLTYGTFYTQSFLTAGLDWTPNARFHIMPNIWYNAYSSMQTTTLSGGEGSAYGTRVKNDNDMVYRVTFYFLFNQNKKVSNNGMMN